MQVSQRKTPVQQRSQATVEYVLDAAARILDQSGLAGLNTNAVARRAGVSIGSLYQYFPGKDAIVAALILRSHQDIVTGLRQLLADTTGMAARPAIGLLIHMLIRMQSLSPRVGNLLEVEEERLPRTPELQALETEISALNLAFFGRLTDPARCSAEQLKVAADDIVCIGRSLLDAAARSGTLDAPDLHERLWRTIAGYVAPLMPSGDGT